MFVSCSDYKLKNLLCEDNYKNKKWNNEHVAFLLGVHQPGLCCYSSNGSTRISPHEGPHMGASVYLLNHNWFLETEGYNETPAESNQFRTNQAAFLGSIWRSLWNETSDNLDPKLGQRQNKEICEFLSVGVETGKFLPKSEAAGDFYSARCGLPLQAVGGLNLYRTSGSMTALQSENRNCK